MNIINGLEKITISFVGLGYVGLCTAVTLSKKYDVIGVEVDIDKVNLINNGLTPFYEKDLKEMMNESLHKNKLVVTSDLSLAIKDSDVTFITVGTPSLDDGSIDLSYIKNACGEIGQVLRNKKTYHLIIVKSTVTPETTERIIIPIIERTSNKKCGKDFGICYNPEFLREGNAIQDTELPDRIIIGQYDDKSGDFLSTIYRHQYENAVPVILKTKLVNAELIKYASNAFLASKISFINSLSNICQQINGSDVTIVAEGMGLDHRISKHFLNAGLGFGGSCFPKDLAALICLSHDKKYDPILIKSIKEVNDVQPYIAIKLAKKHLLDFSNKKISILGLSFKPNTDDVREAVSIKIIKKLLELGSVINTYDPMAMENVKKIFGKDINYSSSVSECVTDSDCCMIVTEWDEFRRINPESLSKLMRTPVLIDGRRVTDQITFKQYFRYEAVGLGLDQNE